MGSRALLRHGVPATPRSGPQPPLPILICPPSLIPHLPHWPDIGVPVLPLIACQMTEHTSEPARLPLPSRSKEIERRHVGTGTSVLQNPNNSPSLLTACQTLSVQNFSAIFPQPFDISKALAFSAMAGGTKRLSLKECLPFSRFSAVAGRGLVQAFASRSCRPATEDARPPGRLLTLALPQLPIGEDLNPPLPLFGHHCPSLLLGRPASYHFG